jgi:hypothetical protein
LIYGLKDMPGSSCCGENIGTHTDSLTTLPWKKKGDLSRHVLQLFVGRWRAVYSRLSLVITFSSPWGKRPGDRDTSHSWGRHDAQAEACGTAGKLLAVAGPGGDVSGAFPGEHVKPAVLVVLP